MIHPLSFENEPTCEKYLIEDEEIITSTISYDLYSICSSIPQYIIQDLDTIEKELFLPKKTVHSDEFEPKIYKNNSAKKRGRGNKSDFIENHHDRFSDDYLAIKIQIKFITYIISFLNDILKNLKYKERFLELNHKIKKNIKRYFTRQLKLKTIGEIISNGISGRYKNYGKDTNAKICEKLKNIEIFRKLLSINYLYFFKKYYFRGQKIINLK